MAATHEDIIYLEGILDPGGVYGVTDKEKLVSKLLLSILQLQLRALLRGETAAVKA